MAHTLCAGCNEVITIPDELVGDLPDSDGYVDGVYYCEACDRETVEDLQLMDGLLDDDCPDSLPEWVVDPRRNGAMNGNE